MLTAKKTPLFRLGLATLTLGVLAVLAAGCSQNAPNAPTDPDLDGLKAIAHVEGEYGPDPLTAGAQDGPAKIVTVSVESGEAVIGPEGGVINLGLGSAASQFVVPHHALTEDVLIRVLAGKFPTPQCEVYLFDFSPDGLKFIRPATLTLHDDFQQGKLAKLYWFNPQTGLWQLQQVGKPDKKGNITFQIFHFSKYAIS